ncbi:lysin [Oenococcus phage Vinitor-27]|nr:lysin [Oenococcus phage Vinitor-27]
MALNGYDISHYQSGLTISKVASDFVILKATEGTTIVDASANNFFSQAKATGRLIGLYHFADTGTAVTQAKYFVNNIKGYLSDKPVLVLDWESTALSQGVAWAKTWLDEVYKLTGVRPLIYMSKSTCNAYNWGSVSANYGLWVAQYASSARTGYQTDPWTDSKGYGTWTNPTIFQYSSSGELSGYSGDLDLDIAYLTKATWAKLGTGSTTEVSTVATITGNKFKVGDYVTVIPKQTKNNTNYDISSWVGAKILIKAVRGKTGAVVYDGVVGTNPYNDLKESNIEAYIDPATVNPLFKVGDQVQISPNASKEYDEYDLTPRHYKVGTIAAVTKLKAKYSRSWFNYGVKYTDGTHNTTVLEQDLVW